jgi:hypothetical protein
MFQGNNSEGVNWMSNGGAGLSGCVIRESNLLHCNYNQILRQRDKQGERENRKGKKDKDRKKEPLLLHELRKTLHYENHYLKIDHDQYFLRPPPTQLSIARTPGRRQDFCQEEGGGEGSAKATTEDSSFLAQ